MCGGTHTPTLPGGGGGGGATKPRESNEGARGVGSQKGLRREESRVQRGSGRETN